MPVKVKRKIEVIYDVEFREAGFFPNGLVMNSKVGKVTNISKIGNTFWLQLDNNNQIALNQNVVEGLVGALKDL